MLGKQCLNRYHHIDQGTEIERSQNRQRKLDGITVWYFDYMVESLPSMLQVALLLLGCALSRYLWEVNTVVASVVIGLTSIGMIFYLVIITAGTVTESCPYKTPWSLIIRHLVSWASSTGLAITSAFRGSKTMRTIAENVQYYHPWWSRREITPFLKDMVLELPHALAIDVYHLGKMMVWSSYAFAVGACHLRVTLFMDLHRSPSILDWGVDLQSISWVLQVSLDKSSHLAALKHLASMMELTNFNPTLAKVCFNTFTDCTTVNNCKVVVIQGSEEVAAVSALCIFSTISHLLGTDPTSSVLEEVHQDYLKVFPVQVNFSDNQFYYTMNVLRCLYFQSWRRQGFHWNGYKPPFHEHAIAAQNFVKIAWFKYQETPGKVPCFVLRFALHSLSLDPLPSTSVIANCLLIIAIDLGCNVSDMIVGYR